MGPSTPLDKEVFEPYHVTMLAGDVVADPGKTLEIVSQGGGIMAMKHSMKHVLVALGQGK